MYNIIEDCSPFYIRFTHPGIESVIDYCNKCLPKLDFLNQDFTQYRLPKNQALKVLSMVPMSKQIPLMENRASLFISKPGLYYKAHKDGLYNRFSINYICQAHDDYCETNWYDDNDLKNYTIDNLPSNTSRECLGFMKENHKPIKSFVAKQGECVLFNTDIFHDWDNRESKNYRIVLTLRIIDKLKSKTYFDDAKNIIFSKE